MSATITRTAGTRRGLLAAAVIAGLAATAAIGAGPANATPQIFPIDSNVTLVSATATAVAELESTLTSLNIPQSHLAPMLKNFATGQLAG
jgi:hypothetical protein